MKIIACIDPEEVVSYFGEGKTLDEAFEDFMKHELENYCSHWEIENGAALFVGLYEAVEVNDEGLSADEEDLLDSEGFEWVLRRKIEEREITYTEGDAR